MVEFEWIHIAHSDAPKFVETYGFAGNQGFVNLEGILIRDKSVKTRTLLIFMHPASTLQLLPIPRYMASLGAHVLCAGSRYARNDSAAILENVLLDLGAYIRHAKEQLGYERIVLAGWSGGGSLALFYQSQALHPSITHTPAGDPVDIVGAGLLPADAIVFQAAHISRAQLLLDIIDPAIRNEFDPDDRDPELDLYGPDARFQPPYPADFIRAYRAAQLSRMRRITADVKQRLTDLGARKTGSVERAFVVHGTLADPRYLDAAIDPNGRRVPWCYLGNPETVNTGPAGLARFTTLRSWLSQWSIDDSNADGIRCAAKVETPLLVIENGADDAVPQPHCRRVYEAAASPDKRFALIEGATHYYVNQPDLLDQASGLILDWLGERSLIDR